MMMENLVSLVKDQRCRGSYCIEEILLLFLVPCLVYMTRMMHTFDEEVREKQLTIELRREELAENVDHLITGMDGILGKVTESSAMLAERSIESHRRAFSRFLQYAGQKWAKTVMTEEEQQILLHEFRRLIKGWLVVFEECSVDPIGSPKRVLGDDELSRCCSIGELCTLLISRLKVAEVRFISSQKEQDTKILEGLYVGTRRLTMTEMPNLEILGDIGDIALDLSQKAFQTGTRAAKGTVNKIKGWLQCPCGWLKFEGMGCSFKNDGFPIEIQFLCLHFTVISKNHSVLLMAGVAGWLAFWVELMECQDIPYLLSVLFYECCIAILLIRFEEIDIIQRMEKELEELAAENIRIKERQEQMCQFWDSVNDLTDLWVHRTVPRLELLKEVHGNLEDAKADELLKLMGQANDRLEMLEENLGDLSDWRSTGALDEDIKKQFGDRIMQLCRGSTVQKINNGLQGVIADVKKVSNRKSGDNAAIKSVEAQNKDFMDTMNFLQNVPLLMRLPKDRQPLLAAACQIRELGPGDHLMRQGDLGKEFYVIRDGQAQVVVSDRSGREEEVAVLKPGDYVGETALVMDEPRTASVVAMTPLEVLVITQRDFGELGLVHMLKFGNRKAVGGGGKQRKIATKPAVPKTLEERTTISQALWRNENLQTMVQLSKEKVNEFVDICWKETIPKGKDLIAEGDLDGDYFYIVQEGGFDIKVMQGSHVKKISEVRKGGSFGELALLYLTPRAATVQATSNSVVWVIDRNSFKNILTKVSEERAKEYVKILSKVEVLSSLLVDEKIALANALTSLTFVRNEVICRQGEKGTTFYILYDGEVAVSQNGKQVAKMEASAAKIHDPGFQGVYFGEKALLQEETRTATVTVTSQTANVLALDQESFSSLLGTITDKMAVNKQSHGRKTIKPTSSVVGGQLPDKPKEHVKHANLKYIGLLGCGTFGYVELVENEETKSTYALKMLSKGYIVRTGMQESIMNEKNILMMTNSPFIIKLFETYNLQQYIAFLLEPALGGELLHIYKTKALYGSEKHAHFYLACVTLGFEHMHTRRIIYRDLKPENIVLNKHGYAKLIDMGLAKFIIGKTFTTCGTPEYFSPEMIGSSGHTIAVDWWALGILLFELLAGHTPFVASHPMGIYAKVAKGIEHVKFPEKIKESAAKLIKDLLQADPTHRLPMRPAGVEGFKKHPWNAGMDWAGVASLMVQPPYTPNVRSKKDLSNIAAKREDMPKPLDYQDDGSGWDAEFATCS